MTIPVWCHVIWMIVAVAFGTWSGYLGLIRATLKGGKSLLPGRYRPGTHKWTGYVFYAMLYVGILYGKIMADFILTGKPEGYWVWHGYTAYAIGVIYFPAMLLGLQMLKSPPGMHRGKPIAHMLLNFTACTLIGVQMALAAYELWWVH